MVQVAGCVKNLAVVWYGVVVHGEVVSPLQVGAHTLHTHTAAGSGRGGGGLHLHVCHTL